MRVVKLGLQRPQWIGLLIGVGFLFGACGSNGNRTCEDGAACDPSATCVNEESSYVCECSPFVFTKDNFADPAVVRDCIQPDVCITRGDVQSLYNGAVETQMESGPGGTAPAGTLWKLGSCQDRSPDTFGPFLSASFTNSNPPTVIDQPGCLYLPAHDEYYSITFLSFTTGGTGGGGGGGMGGGPGGGGGGGGFSYERTLVQPDGVACP